MKYKPFFILVERKKYLQKHIYQNAECNHCSRKKISTYECPPHVSKDFHFGIFGGFGVFVYTCNIGVFEYNFDFFYKLCSINFGEFTLFGYVMWRDDGCDVPLIALFITIEACDECSENFITIVTFIYVLFQPTPVMVVCPTLNNSRSLLCQ